MKLIVTFALIAATTCSIPDALTIRELLESGLTVQPPAQCLAVMDEWCNEAKNCPNKGTKFALRDASAHSADVQWRCYSQNTLNTDHTRYVKGVDYCTRDAQLESLLHACDPSAPTPSTPTPPPPPAPTPQPFELNSSTVFELNLAGVACYRIPAVVQTDKGTLVAFAEARHGSCGDGAVQELATRRSTDGGRTWGDVKPAVGNSSYFVGNPSAVFTESKKIVLVYVKHSPKCTGDCGTGNAMVVSEDDGLTWGPPQDLSTEFGPASGSLPGPGHTLQLTQGDKKGRLMVVSHHSAYVHDFVSVSDDDGKTWSTISQVFPKMDEAQLTQLSNGSVMLNMRHQASKTKGRAIAISHDGGDTFGPIQYDAALISPVCQASIVTFGGTTYFSNPASKTGRDHTTIRRSTDNAATWSSSLLVEAGGSAGYSCLVDGEIASASGHGGILYEAPGSTIKFAQFPLKF